MTSASLIPPETFWIPLLTGLLASIVVTGILLLTTVKARDPKTGKKIRSLRAHQWAWWKQGVWTEAAWTFKDSWATNITAVGAALGIVAGTNTPANALTPSSATTPHEFVSLGIVFGGASVLAPLVYGALAKKPKETKHPHELTADMQDATATFDAPSSSSSPSSSSVPPPQVQGSIGGLLVASAFTVFAVMGALAALATYVDTSSATGFERWALIAASSIAAIFVGLYAVRSFRALAAFAASDEKPIHHRSSFLSGTQVSATL